jgi:hypothetical protein
MAVLPHAERKIDSSNLNSGIRRETGKTVSFFVIFS